LNRSVSEFDRKKHETRYLCEQSCWFVGKLWLDFLQELHGRWFG
jgi:hypothetical protein